MTQSQLRAHDLSGPHPREQLAGLFHANAELEHVHAAIDQQLQDIQTENIEWVATDCCKTRHAQKQ